MKIFVATDYQKLSALAAQNCFGFMAGLTRPLVCTASGDSPAVMYQELVKLIRQQPFDLSNTYFLGLDEWIGMNGNDEGSCRYHLDRQLYQQLSIPPDKIVFFDGRAGDPGKECAAIESFIQAHNGLNLAILGLGSNGHIGMNEPGSSSSQFSHVADIAPITQKTGQKYFKHPQNLERGLTLGLATILKADKIMLLVSGAHKAHIVKRMLEEEVSEQLPATCLRNHPAVEIYLDQDASSLIDPSHYEQ